MRTCVLVKGSGRERRSLGRGNERSGRRRRGIEGGVVEGDDKGGECGARGSKMLSCCGSGGGCGWKGFCVFKAIDKRRAEWRDHSPVFSPCCGGRRGRNSAREEVRYDVSFAWDVLDVDVKALSTERKASSTAAILMRSFEEVRQTLVISTNDSGGTDNKRAPCLEGLDQPKSLLIAHTPTAFFIGETAGPRSKRAVRLRVFRFITLRKNTTNAHTRGCINVHIKVLRIVRSGKSGDSGKAMFRMFERSLETERPHDLFGRGALCLEVMKWREECVEVGYEAMVMAYHAGVASSRRGIMSHVRT
jgi:hypothetical protein